MLEKAKRWGREMERLVQDERPGFLRSGLPTQSCVRLTWAENDLALPKSKNVSGFGFGGVVQSTSVGPTHSLTDWLLLAPTKKMKLAPKGGGGVDVVNVANVCTVDVDKITKAFAVLAEGKKQRKTSSTSTSLVMGKFAGDPIERERERSFPSLSAATASAAATAPPSSHTHAHGISKMGFRAFELWSCLADNVDVDDDAAAARK